MDKEGADIEVKIRDLSQLFNSMDPSPFHEKDLDDDAVEFIVGWSREFPPQAVLRLVIHLETLPGQGDPQAIVREAVQNFFRYKAGLTRRELRRMMSLGRTSLAIGLSFLAGCVVVGELVRQWWGEGTLQFVVREGLYIGGWVAMWRPMQIFLYDWWPLAQLRRLYDRLAEMEVNVRVTTRPAAGATFAGGPTAQK